MMPHVRLLLLSVTCALCLPALATGQERARPDPDSPAGVEYQLPLDQAREDAAGEGAGEGKRGRGESKPPPLFGSGVTETQSPPAAGSSNGSASAAGERSSGEARAGERRAAAIPATSEGGPGASVSLIAAAVLIVGGVLGLGMRRGMGRTGRS